ncbi:MAG: Hsp33 family molecular chaperone HslO [Acidobacteria bacterium]|nr:Hsp33 family molecular chaperone HslO [Acidobacteriota bacterium]
MPDELLRAVGLDGRVRAVAASTTRTVERLRVIHDPSPTVTAALGRAATAALLLAASLEKVTRREPMVTLEIDGNGPAGRLLATASPAGWVRATVGNPLAEASLRKDGKLHVAGVVGDDGSFIVTRDPGIGEPYRGVVKLVSGEIAKDLAHYLTESEQTPAAAALGVFVVPEGRVRHAGGYIVQLLGGVSDAEAAELAESVTRLGTVTTRMREGQGPEGWLEQLFPGGFQIVGQGPVCFRCGCSRDRVERAVKLLGENEVRSLLEESLVNPVTLTCGFCKTAYSVARDDLARLLLEVETESKDLRKA